VVLGWGGCQLCFGKDYTLPGEAGRGDGDSGVGALAAYFRPTRKYRRRIDPRGGGLT
jgi:hypothetical protein